MGLDLTTFVLEIVNFLVLLWLLSHFLYRPVQAAIARRQQQAEQARQALEAQRLSLEAKQTELQQIFAPLRDELVQLVRQLQAAYENWANATGRKIPVTAS